MSAKVIRHNRALTPYQAGLIASVERLCWKFARVHTPAKYRRCEWAIELTYDEVMKVAFASAQTFDPLRGTQFTTYLGRWVSITCWRFWKERNMKRVESSSINSMIDDDGTELESLIPDHRQSETISFEEANQVADAIRFLPPREQLAIKKLFGFGDGSECTQAELARELGVSRQRVQNLVQIALSKLRKRLQLEAMS